MNARTLRSGKRHGTGARRGVVALALALTQALTQARAVARALAFALALALSLALGLAAAAAAATLPGAAREGEALPAAPTATPDMPPGCARADTQAALNACAYDDFLAASAALAAQLREVESRLSPTRRAAWRKVQKAWLGYRTEACRFESAAVGTGSAAPMVQWQCSARLTRLRSDELARSLSCREGDVSCALRRKE